MPQTSKMSAEMVLEVIVPEMDQETKSDPNLTTSEFPTGDLWTWHGAELIFIPLMMVVGVIGNLLVYYIYHFRWRTNTVTLYKRVSLKHLENCKPM
ncbi:neuropeptide Y [Elysia marginata]|uniref:Neuropeptide Y n=1 Tax=Elysia marginata TaxID=1093978 RepID=A0AAV4FNW2_9GAST|nr:neuropeptide Y [Elysia marginata]